MATFQIPQFIEQKAKIVGPLTLTQFMYIAAAGGLSFICYYIFNFFLWLLITIVLGGIAIMLAFVKINGQDMPQVIFSAIGYLFKPRVYTWQRVFEEKSVEAADLEKIEEARKNMSIQEKLKSIALSITTGKLLSPKEWRRQEVQKERFQPVTFLTGERRLAKRVDFPREVKQ